jgi:hypothetical protein
MHVPRRPPSVGFVVQSINRSPLDFEAQTKKPSRWFWGPNHQTKATSFDAQTRKPSTTLFWGSTKKPTADFEAKPGETVATSFEAKLEKTVWVVLRPNHSQTVDLGFVAQPRNPPSSSPRARCRPHTAPPDLLIVRPPSTRPVRSSPILCTRSPTPATILITARHAAPTTCTPRDKDKRKTKWNCSGFEFKPRQVNDSS